METVVPRGNRGDGDDGWELGMDASTSPTPAVRGRATGSVAWTGADDGDALASFLGWFSVGLGAAQVIAPRAVARLIGVEPGRGTTTVMRIAGLREIAHGAGILANPRPKEWIGTRIGGDVLDLALLGAAFFKANQRNRTLLATGAVLGVTALDILAFQELSESRKAPSPGAARRPGTRASRSITVGVSPEEVYRFWRDFENLPRFMKQIESVRDLGDGRWLWRARGPRGARGEWETELVEDRPGELITWESVGTAEFFNAGTVHFQRAPRDRGTIVTLEMQYAPLGGSIGAAMLRLFRMEPGQQAGDDLRRLKQLLELGEVVLSDATAVPRLHPAQPPQRADRP
jgi:uncharacterized membrane protein